MEARRYILTYLLSIYYIGNSPLLFDSNEEMDDIFVFNILCWKLAAVFDSNEEMHVLASNILYWKGMSALGRCIGTSETGAGRESQIPDEEADGSRVLAADGSQFYGR